MKSVLGGLGIGVSAGILSGLIGIGGGIIIVPALGYFFGMDQKTAQGINANLGKVQINGAAVTRLQMLR